MHCIRVVLGYAKGRSRGFSFAIKAQLKALSHCVVLNMACLGFKGLLFLLMATTNPAHLHSRDLAYVVMLRSDNIYKYVRDGHICMTLDCTFTPVCYMD